MIERDAHIPLLAELMTEWEVARDIAQKNPANVTHWGIQPSEVPVAVGISPLDESPGQSISEKLTLADVQHQWAYHVLDQESCLKESMLKASQDF